MGPFGLLGPFGLSTMRTTYNNTTNFLKMGDRQNKTRRQDDENHRIIGLRNLAKASAAQKSSKINEHAGLNKRVGLHIR